MNARTSLNSHVARGYLRFVPNKVHGMAEGTPQVRFGMILGDRTGQ
jgi:hypothetical protein